jgi:hypothetical protein
MVYESSVKDIHQESLKINNLKLSNQFKLKLTDYWPVEDLVFPKYTF